MTDIAPVLASSLLTDKELDRILAGVVSGVGGRGDYAEEHLTTGFQGIDTAVLDGGLESGRVVEVAGDEGSGRAEISKAFLTSFLLQHNSNNQKHTAAVVDTTGNFDVVGLYASLLTRLVKEQQMQKSEAEKMAAEMLDRVKIMRVFDFEGVREAVDEIRGEIEAGVASEKKDAKQEKKRTYVADSEDEEDEDDEMLFDASAPTASKQETNIPNTPKFILIDNLTQVVSPLLKQDTIQGTSQTSTLLTTLANLTHTHALYTLLITPLTTNITTTSVPPPRAPTSPTRLEQDKDMAPPVLSIFGSNKATSSVSGLAALMGLYADVRVVVSWVPRRRGDARLYYADEGGRRTGRRGECGGVVEVVGDRWGRRMGAWGVFGV